MINVTSELSQQNKFNLLWPSKFTSNDFNFLVLRLFFKIKFPNTVLVMQIQDLRFNL